MCDLMIIGQTVHHTSQPSHQHMRSQICKRNQAAITSISITEHFIQTEHADFDRSLPAQEVEEIQTKNKT